MAVRKCKKKQTKQRLDEPKKANLALGDRLHFSSQKIIKRSQCLVFRIWRITSPLFLLFQKGPSEKGPDPGSVDTAGSDVQPIQVKTLTYYILKS